MDFVPLGTTGLKVSGLCFGTMSFGDIADEETSAKMFHRCREVGINMFDCANVYANGRSEEILGQLIAGSRDEVIVTSKVYFPAGDDINARGGSRRHIMQQVEKSLTRLQTDYIDIYFLHRFDPATPLEETLRALDDLVSQGKILYPAVSNFAAWQVMKALGITRAKDWVPIIGIQPMYNLVKRQAEVEIFPLAEAENLAVFPYSPLGGGLLTGKYEKEKRPDTGRLVENEMYQIRYGEATNYEVAERFAKFAREEGYRPAALAVAWAASHPAVTAPLIGARNPGQLEESLQALQIEMTPDLRQAISDLSPTPPPATDRTEERAGYNYKHHKK